MLLLHPNTALSNVAVKVLRIREQITFISVRYEPETLDSDIALNHLCVLKNSKQHLSMPFNN